MSKSLIIAEKPSVAQDIARSLGGFESFEGFMENRDYVVSWAVGHVLELKEPEDINPAYKSWKLEDLPIVPPQFELRPKQGQSKILGTLKKLLKRPDVADVVNACDAGREGELIFREIMQYFSASKPTKRLWLQSMQPAAIRKGFEELRPGSEFDRLGEAAQCRSEADWLIGINATRALTRRMKLRTEHSAWSAGRVQTPTLALLVDRELEILQHRPEPFWRIEATFQAPGHDYKGTWFDPKFQADPDSPRKDDWITDRTQLEAILAAVRGQSGSARETRKTSSEVAPPLFDLTSLQREANRRMGYSAKRTLQAAQRLYETHKMITYPRTDSRCLPTDYRAHVDTVLDQLANSRNNPYASAARSLKAHGLRNLQRNFDDSGVSDHFAIIPTTEDPGHHLSGDEARIYDLIVRRFLAAFYPPATWMRVERVTEVAANSFRTRSRYLVEQGWYEVWGRDVDEERALPPLVEGRSVAAAEPAEGVGVRNVDVDASADETRPPARITEARLLTLMEHAGKQVEDENLSKVLLDKGLGTPATRAEIIENLVTKQYAIRNERAMRATAKGILLIDLLRRIRVSILASPELTGEIEQHLRQIEEGKRQRDGVMDEIVGYTRDIIEQAKGFDYDEIYRKEPPLGACPACKQRKVYEKARFYACEGNTGKNEGVCSFSLWKDRTGRYLDRKSVGELLARGETPMLDGFLTKRGDSFKGVLRITDVGTVELVGDRPADAETEQETFPVSSEPLGNCPFAPAQCQVAETPTHYQCQAKCVEKDPRRKSGFTLPRMVCKRVITREEAIHYLKSGKTELIEDFTSRYGRHFKAYLVMKDTGRHGFEFLPREPRRKGGAGAATENAEPAARGRRGVKGAAKAAAARAASAGKKPAGKATKEARPKKAAATKTRARKKAAVAG